MKNELLTVKEYYIKHRRLTDTEPKLKFESFNKFFERESGKLFNCTKRTAYNHYKDGYGYIYISNNITLHLSEVRK